MPEVFRWRGFRFFFYSNEGSPREPCHVHVEHADGEAKVRHDPEIRLELWIEQPATRLYSCRRTGT